MNRLSITELVKNSTRVHRKWSASLDTDPSVGQSAGPIWVKVAVEVKFKVKVIVRI